MRNGGRTSSRSQGVSNSGTTLPLSGHSASCSSRCTISPTSLSPTSGTDCATYQSRSSSRSRTADSAIETRRRPILDEPEPTPGLRQRELAPILEIGQTAEHGAHELALLLRRLELRESLNDGDPAPAAGQENRTTGLVEMPDDLAGVDLQVAERDDVFREPHQAAHQTSIECPVLVPIIAPPQGTSSLLVVRPHAQDLHDLLVVEDLVDQPMLDVDAPRVRAGTRTRSPTGSGSIPRRGSARRGNAGIRLASRPRRDITSA